MSKTNFTPAALGALRLAQENAARLGHSYVYVLEGRVQAVFAMIPGEDPTYRVIQGAWLNDLPYCAVHRVASRGEVKGVATQVLEWCMDRCGNIRIDTHADNRVMQHLIVKCGFTRCGIIRLENGDPRIAYEKEGTFVRGKTPSFLEKK